MNNYEFWINHGIWGVRILTQHCVNQLIPYRGFEPYVNLKVFDRHSQRDVLSFVF